jgi:hypothetical protein
VNACMVEVLCLEAEDTKFINITFDEKLQVDYLVLVWKAFALLRLLTLAA